MVRTEDVQRDGMSPQEAASLIIESSVDSKPIYVGAANIDDATELSWAIKVALETLGAFVTVEGRHLEAGVDLGEDLRDPEVLVIDLRDTESTANQGNRDKWV